MMDRGALESLDIFMHYLSFLKSSQCLFVPCVTFQQKKNKQNKSAAQSNEEFHFVDAGQEFVISLI